MNFIVVHFSQQVIVFTHQFRLFVERYAVSISIFLSIDAMTQLLGVEKLSPSRYNQISALNNPLFQKWALE